MCLKLERIANLIRCNVRRGHSAAIYTSGRRSTSVGHKNKLFRVSHTGTPVDTWGVSMFETCAKKISIPALVREKFMSSAWNPSKNRQLYPTSKQCFIFLFLASNIGVISIPFCFILIGEKRLRTSEDIRNPPPPEEGKQRTPHPEDGDVVEIVTTTGDLHVVEEQSPYFTNDSAQRLIHDIMFCSCNLDIIKQKTNEIEQKLKNMIDVLERI
ncbi:hypothetical protein AB205_0104980 [Aquarana catesbeiana]|uniref:Uncharacterized protein n=1 Tax=Aquarana catesbeiana TaxID=8400 RepID=A0A2G9S7H1_AQUCT|nr:hypothetical protein AB205_0104980 [Aquarana catesbeiana]